MPDPTVKTRIASPWERAWNIWIEAVFLLPIQGAVWWWWPSWHVAYPIALFWLMRLGVEASVFGFQCFLRRYFGGDALAALQALERYFAPKR